MIIGATTAGIASGTTQTANATGAGDSNDFMLLLLAQLRNQNPLDPVKDKDFMTQLTQVNSFLELQKVNKTLLAATRSNTLTQAASLIGKTVSYPSGSGPATAVVSGVRQDGDRVMLLMGDQEISLDYVTGVGPAPVAGGVTA